ncbi:MAG TPA: DUF2393 family protein [Terriglobales bacterium]|nr:DUF2393 family protein [Terriglobales bacterium]
MGGWIQPSPVAQEPDSSRRIIIIVAIAAVAIVAIGIALLLRASPKPQEQIPPYASQLKISDLKMSQSQNFVGANVTYIDGTLANAGNKTVGHTTVRVTFKDLYGQVAQIEEVPIKILQTNGPYPDTVDLSVVPLAPGQSKPFRLIFEHVSEQWNQAYPELQIVNIQLK